MKNQNDFCDIDEAIKLTGFKKNTLYQLTSKKKIPHFRLGGKLRFSRSELTSWIENHRVPVLEGGCDE